MNKFFLQALLLLILCAPTWAQTAINTTVAIPLVGSSLVTLQGQVPAGNAMTFTITGGPSIGTVSLFNADNGTFVYTPSFSFGGATDSITFTVTATPLAGGAGTTSSAGTVTIVLSPDRTTIEHQFLRPDGTPRTGTVSFVLTQQAQNGALVSVGSAVTVTLDAQGRAFTSLTPSEGLFPVSYYGVYLRDSTGKQETYGLYNVKAAPSGTIAPLGSAYVVDVGQDANLRARFTFASQSAVEGLLNLVRTYTVQNNGTNVGAQSKINFIPGAGLSQNIINNTVDNRIDIELTCPSCPGGNAALATGTLGRLAYYSAGNTVSSLGIGTANQLLGVNATANGYEHKTIVGTGGITLTPGIGTLAIGYSGTSGLTSLGGLTGANQSFAIVNSGCTSPAWSHSGTTHYLCLPLASTGNSLGLVTNSTQSFGGAKQFEYVSSDTFATLNGTSLAAQMNDFGIAGIRGAFGRSANLTPSASSTLGFAISDTGNDDTVNNVEEYLNTVVTTGAVSRSNHFLYGTFFSTTPITGPAASLRVFGNYTGNSTVSDQSAYDGLLEKTGVGTITRGQVYRGSLSVPVGTLTNGAVFYAANGVKDPAATVTNGYGLFVENVTYATNNYSIYTADDGTGGAGAPVSIGSALELRGMGDSGILPAGTDNASFIYNADKNQIQISQEGGNFRNLAGYGTRVTKNITGNVSFDLSEASFFDATLTGNVTQVTATNQVAGQVVYFLVRNSAAGNLTLNESGSVFHFPGGTNPGISTGANVKDLWVCVSTGTNLICTVTYDIK